MSPLFGANQLGGILCNPSTLHAKSGRKEVPVMLPQGTDVYNVTVSKFLWFVWSCFEFAVVLQLWNSRGTDQMWRTFVESLTPPILFFPMKSMVYL